MDPHAGQRVVEAGAPLGGAPVVILVHGRNAGPENILDLVPRLARTDFTYLAPAAADRTWYPLGFMAETAQNEPKLTSALHALASLVARVEAAGVPRARIVMMGFSQGACLTSEFVVRHPARYGGVVAFTGGLIGPPGTTWNETGSFDGTPMFFGSGDPDGHVPVARVQETAGIFTRMGAAVTTRIYPGRAHTVSGDEIVVARAVLDEAARVTVLSGGAAGAGGGAGALGSDRGLTPVWHLGVRPRSDPQSAAGLDALPAELDARGWSRVLAFTTPGRAAAAVHDLASLLGSRLVHVMPQARPHVPAPLVAEAADLVDRHKPDALMAVGGGSAVGLAKAVALGCDLPIIAVPTTYSGSEMTSIWGVTTDGVKTTGRDRRAAPRVVVYDPRLTLTLPPRASAASGMNAIAHAVEALYASTAGVIAAGAAQQAIRLLSRALPGVVADPGAIAPRAMAQVGGHLGGVALEHASMGLHHKLCHVLGGSFGLPHAETHAVLLPHVVAFNAPAAPEAMAQVADALGVSDAAAGLHALNRTLGLPVQLGALGFRGEDIDRAADLAAAGSYPNPRPVTAGDIRTLLKLAMK